MKYKVISYFEDLQDGSHAYNVGDTYPRKGLRVTDERVAELKSDSNKQKKPLIEDFKDSKSEYSDYEE